MNPIFLQVTNYYRTAVPAIILMTPTLSLFTFPIPAAQIPATSATIAASHTNTARAGLSGDRKRKGVLHLNMPGCPKASHFSSDVKVFNSVNDCTVPQPYWCMERKLLYSR